MFNDAVYTAEIL